MWRAGAIFIFISMALGGVIRLWSLDTVPVALYCDEAFQGYEALALLETGSDSRGVSTPLFFDIFGVGWQEPAYIYLTTLPVALLGTTETAVRLVAALAGTLALGAVAWMAVMLRGMPAGIGAILCMAVSPWAFHFSRVGFQASLMPFFLAAGAGMLLHAVRDGAEGRGGAYPSGNLHKNPGGMAQPALAWLLAGAGVLTLTLYTYVAARLIVPVLLAIFAVVFRRRLMQLGIIRLGLIAGLVLLVALPVLLFSFTASGMERYADVGLFSRYGGMEAAGKLLSNYFSYFTPAFLLLDGDPNERHSVQGFGMLHLHGILLLAAGVVASIRRRHPADLFFLGWLVAGPLPGALGVDPGHAVRAIGVLPAIYVLMGCGAATLFARGGLLEGRRLARLTIVLVLSLLAAWSSGSYLYHYFVVYPKYSGQSWQFGLKEAYREADAMSADHDSIYVTRGEDFPFIHYLFFNAYPPSRYQAEQLRGTRYLFDEPTFYAGGIIPGRENPLFILKPDEVPASGIQHTRSILYPDGTPAFVLAW
jgi:4-amino-4-deoxy-L-arabinose transferase-like glycosyltransferase